jgi:hypothetical protein
LAKRQKKVTPITDATLIDDFVSVHEKGYERANTKYYIPGDENAKYRRGIHWSEAGIAQHIADKRIDYHMPLVEAKFNGLESQQMMSPFEFVCLPATPEADLQAEIKNALFKYEYEQNDGMYLISDWYRDMLVKKYGVIRREIDKSQDLQGNLKLTKVLYNKFLWDDNCKVYNVARFANWVQEWGESTREELKMRYPEKSDLIDKLPEAGDDRTTTATTINWQRTDRSVDLIRWVRHQQRRWQTIYKVTFNDGKTEESEIKPDLKGLPPQEQWQTDFETGSRYPVSVIPIPKEFIDDYVFTKDVKEMLSHRKIDSVYFNYHMAFAFNDDGECASLMDWAKQPQRFIDRITSQFDKSIGLLIKNSFQTEWDMLIPEDQNNWVRLQQDLINGGANIRTRGANGRDVIKPISAGQVAPELFQAFQFAVTILDTLMGGVEAFGMTTPQNQTKGGIEAVQRAGFNMAYMFIFNLGRALKGLGEGMNEDINEIYGSSVERTIAITDNDLDEAVLEMLKDLPPEQGGYVESKLKPGRGWLKITPQLDLGNAKTKIIITKGDYSPSRKEQKRLQWELINQQRIDAGLPPYDLSIWGNDAFDISPTVMAKVKKADEDIAAAQAKQAEMAEKKMVFDGNLAMMKENREAHAQLQGQENTDKDRETEKANQNGKKK